MQTLVHKIQSNLLFLVCLSVRLSYMASDCLMLLTRLRTSLKLLKLSVPCVLCSQQPLCGTTSHCWRRCQQAGRCPTHQLLDNACNNYEDLDNTDTAVNSEDSTSQNDRSKLETYETDLTTTYPNKMSNTDKVTNILTSSSVAASISAEEINFLSVLRPTKTGTFHISE